MEFPRGRSWTSYYVDIYGYAFIVELTLQIPRSVDEEYYNDIIKRISETTTSLDEHIPNPGAIIAPPRFKLSDGTIVQMKSYGPWLFDDVDELRHAIAVDNKGDKRFIRWLENFCYNHCIMGDDMTVINRHGVSIIWGVLPNNFNQTKFINVDAFLHSKIGIPMEKIANMNEQSKTNEVKRYLQISGQDNQSSSAGSEIVRSRTRNSRENFFKLLDVWNEFGLDGQPSMPVVSDGDRTVMITGSDMRMDTLEARTAPVRDHAKQVILDRIYNDSIKSCIGLAKNVFSAWPANWRSLLFGNNDANIIYVIDSRYNQYRPVINSPDGVIKYGIEIPDYYEVYSTVMIKCDDFISGIINELRNNPQKSDSGDISIKTSLRNFGTICGRHVVPNKSIGGLLISSVSMIHDKDFFVDLIGNAIYTELDNNILGDIEEEYNLSIIKSTCQSCEQVKDNVLRAYGVCADCMNESNPDEWRNIESQIKLKNISRLSYLYDINNDGTFLFSNNESPKIKASLFEFPFLQPKGNSKLEKIIDLYNSTMYWLKHTRGWKWEKGELVYNEAMKMMANMDCTRLWPIFDEAIKYGLTGKNPMTYLNTALRRHDKNITYIDKKNVPEQTKKHKDTVQDAKVNNSIRAAADKADDRVNAYEFVTDTYNKLMMVDGDDKEIYSNGLLYFFSKYNSQYMAVKLINDANLGIIDNSKKIGDMLDVVFSSDNGNVVDNESEGLNDTDASPME